MTIPSRLLMVSMIGAAVALVAFLALGPALAIRAVSVVGYTGPDAPQLRHALVTIAMSGTALRGADDAIRAYAGTVPSIRAITIERAGVLSTRITVATRAPVAVLHGAGAPRAVAADGTYVRGQRGLATVNVAGATAAQQRQLLAIAAAIPARHRSDVRALEIHRGAMRARLASGTPIRLGAPHGGTAKGWALGRILTALNLQARDVAYIDASVPQRVVLGPARA